MTTRHPTKRAIMAALKKYIALRMFLLVKIELLVSQSLVKEMGKIKVELVVIDAQYLDPSKLMFALKGIQFLKSYVVAKSKIGKSLSLFLISTLPSMHNVKLLTSDACLLWSFSLGVILASAKLFSSPMKLSSMFLFPKRFEDIAMFIPSDSNCPTTNPY